MSGLRVEYGEVKTIANIEITVNGTDKDVRNLENEVCDAFKDLSSEVEIDDFSYEPESEDYDGIVEFKASFLTPAKATSWDATWGYYGGEPGGYEVESDEELTDDSIKDILQAHFNSYVSVFVTDSEFIAA